MALLLDTHVLLWWLGDRVRLSQRARDAIGYPRSRIFVSVASLWEIAIKVAAGKLVIPNDIEAVLDLNGFQVLPIFAAHALGVMTLSAVHKDPFDRLLVAQALHEGLTLVTHDPWVLNYPVATIRA